jgi:hypothetical protein
VLSVLTEILGPDMLVIKRLEIRFGVKIAMVVG